MDLIFCSAFTVWDYFVTYMIRPGTLFLVAAVGALVLFYWPYMSSLRRLPARLEGGGDATSGESDSATLSDSQLDPPAPPRLIDSFDLRRGSLAKRDWLPIAVITCVYALAAFLNLGDFTAPQSFWRATADQPSVTVDLGEKYQLNSLVYYTGLFHGGWSLDASGDGVIWTPQEELSQKHSEVFKWMTGNVADNFMIRYLRITTKKAPMEMGELAVYANSESGPEMLDSSRFTYDDPSASALFDEQSIVRDKQTYLNSAYFDEIYHARAAYEFKTGLYPYENTHPPLGKLIILQGINLFGMDPFGWRFMGALFGVLMLPIVFILLKLIFNNTFVASCGAVIFASDFMHFTQTRIATIDVYAVFFILLMYLFMWMYITSGLNSPFRKTILPLALCGLSFGLGAASKWTCIYAGAGLLVLYVLYLIQRGRRWFAEGRKKEYFGFLLSTFGVSVIAFIIVPALVYCLSYIPYATADNGVLTEDTLWDKMITNQESMFKYHSELVDTHPYESAWYQWPFDIRPTLFYADSTDTVKSQFGTFGSPLLWWGGLIALVLACIRVWKTRSLALLFIIIGFLSQYLPWLLVSRITFIYHYFPSTVFLLLALCYVLYELDRHFKNGRRRVYIFTAVSVGLFVMFYPAISGLPAPLWYAQTFLTWLPSWPL